MHVGLNLVFLTPGETGGMEVAARELVAALRETGVRLTAFVGQEAAGGSFEVPEVVVPVNASSRIQWVRGEQKFLPRMAEAAACDVVHSLASTAPLYGQFARVATIHDLNYARVPEAHFGLRGLGMRVLVPAAAETSHRIITLASSTVDDLVELLSVSPSKVDVVPHGVRLPGPVDAARVAALRSSLGIADGRKVLLSASAKRPHKNLLRLLDAHALFDAAARPVLVLPGYATPHEADLRARVCALGTDADVRFLGWVDDADFAALYELADAFVFPSLYEGFGLPVLEAMAHGVPVACSSASCLPEVAGGAALLFDPLSVGAMHDACASVLSDDGVRSLLVAAGLARARSQTWARAAELTVESYERAVAAARS